MDNKNLIVAGSGIKFFAHLTEEAKAAIIQCEHVLYLLNDPLMEKWIQENNANSESLEKLYRSFFLRADCYKEITKYILNYLNVVDLLCVVVEGHPTVLAQPILDAVHEANKKGANTTILPGLSAEDCLFADLQIDPGEYGCQSYDATDFLIRPRNFDNFSHLILWQIATIGVLTHSHTAKIDNIKNGLETLTNKLSNYYPLSHTIFIYEASQYSMFKSVIKKSILSALPNELVSSISTLYVPPQRKANLDIKMMKKLKISVADLN